MHGRLVVGLGAAIAPPHAVPEVEQLGNLDGTGEVREDSVDIEPVSIQITGELIPCEHHEPTARVDLGLHCDRVGTRVRARAELTLGDGLLSAGLMEDARPHLETTLTAIRENIQHLYSHILGEELDINDPAIDAAYQLFYDTWQDGVAAVAADEASNDLSGECRADDNYWTGEDYADEVRVINDSDYTVRAWMAVVTYLLSDYRFLHE